MASQLDTTKLDAIVNGLKPKTKRIIITYGTKIAGDAARLAPVDTGALRNSILSESGMQKEFVFIVQDGVEYGIFQELGTSRMAAHPFVVPAVLKNEKGYADAFKELFK